MADLHMGLFSDHEVAECIDQGIASLNARFEDRDEIRAAYPDLSGEAIDELHTAIAQAADTWDVVANSLPGFRA